MRGIESRKVRFQLSTARVAAPFRPVVPALGAVKVYASLVRATQETGRDRDLTDPGHGRKIGSANRFVKLLISPDLVLICAVPGGG